jgi:hypothetical protein
MGKIGEGLQEPTPQEPTLLQRAILLVFSLFMLACLAYGTYFFFESGLWRAVILGSLEFFWDFFRSWFNF